MSQHEFQELIRETIESDIFLKTKLERHHINSSVYHHSIKVAYLCYRHWKRFRTNIPLKELIRGALLHDFYLYDWNYKNSSPLRHIFTHPRRALQNARRYYPELSPCEEDIILHHMFPVIPVPPKTHAGWLVCIYDKVAAISDYLSR